MITSVSPGTPSTPSMIAGGEGYSIGQSVLSAIRVTERRTQRRETVLFIEEILGEDFSAGS